MAAETIIELTRSFDAPALNVEQAERLQAIRQAAASFAAVLHSGMPASVYRDLSIDGLRNVMALVAQGVAIERPGGSSAVEQRLKLLDDLADRVTPSQLGRVAAMLGVSAPEKRTRKGGRE